jgi:hypothetical protein
MINRKEMVEAVQALTDEKQEAPMLSDIIKKTGLNEHDARAILNMCIGENKIIAKGSCYLTKKDADEYWKYKSQWGQVKIPRKDSFIPVDCGEAQPVYVEKEKLASGEAKKRGRKPKNEIT